MKLQTKWTAPLGGGAPLLTMPNVPLPMHKLPPREIMGQTAWDKVRKQCYEDASDICEISGVKLGNGRNGTILHHAHELYDFDFEKMEMRFIRPICISPIVHNFIHSGRAITCYTNHEPLWTKEYMLQIAETGFKLIADWNVIHPDSPLYVYEAFTEWLKEPSLATEVQSLMDKYYIEMWSVPNRKEWDNAWGKWKLIYNDVEYYSPYQSREEWEDATQSQHPKENKELFAGDEFEALRRNIHESK